MRTLPPGHAGSGLAEFLSQRHTVGRGRVGQAIAEAYLVREGYDIVGRNWRCAFGEIDLLAFDGDCLCILEVKARFDPRFGPASLAVGRGKQRQLIRLATHLLATSGYRGPCRFDVVGVDRVGDEWQVTLHRGAFDASP